MSGRLLLRLPQVEDMQHRKLQLLRAEQPAGLPSQGSRATPRLVAGEDDRHAAEMSSVNIVFPAVLSGSILTGWMNTSATG